MATRPTLTRTDPLRDFKFRVQIFTGGRLNDATQGIDNLGFAVMSGLSVQNEVISYREGGMNTNPHKMLGQSDFAPVTFSRGVYAGSSQDQLWQWQKFMHNWIQGDASGSTAKDDYRADIKVTIYDHPATSMTYEDDPSSSTSTILSGSPRLTYNLFNCWPGGFSLGDLNAGSSSLLIQQLTIHHEGFTIDWATT